MAKEIAESFYLINKKAVKLSNLWSFKKKRSHLRLRLPAEIKRGASG
jgi:hypothetical protein